ncbi:MAG TPA: peptidase MA family metallohydrolase [Anaerolineales bacterium]|nr:peptidase MA family metallohydrolase [Anaerolineales bacterium]
MKKMLFFVKNCILTRIPILLALILNSNLFIVQPAFASSQIEVTDDQAIISFPISVIFQATINSSAKITSVILEYGTDQITCGEVIAKAFPQFTPDTSVNVQWTWEMRQSGSLPPGATIWWRWRYTDETGKETLSDQQTITWLDSDHDWKTISAENINLHWYWGDQAFVQDLLNAAKNGLDFNQTRSGLTAQSPIDLYIYANTSDLRDAVLYEPSWTGGQAFAAHDIVIIGISQSDLDWGRDAIVHELTHVLVGHFTFSCLGGVPTWLNEGLAVYSEGELDPSSQRQLDNATREDTLLTVRSLSAGFSEVPSKASLSYSQSYSIVNFLIESYGQEKMTQLLTFLRDGATIDDALMDTYGFDVEGLDDAWRESIQAPPRSDSAQPTAQPTPTYVPTIVPISGAPLANQIATPTPLPTSSIGEPTDETPPPVRGRPPLSLTLILLALCCIFILLIGVIVLGFIVRRENRQGEDNE